MAENWLTNGSLSVDVDSGNLKITGGDVGIGATPIRKFHVAENADALIAYFSNAHATPYGLLVVFTEAAPNNKIQHFLGCSDSEGAECYIWSDGSFVQVSDLKTKKDVADTPSQLGNIIKLRVVNYQRKNDVTNHEHIGFIAQEVQEVYPHLISMSNEGTEKERMMMYKIGMIPMAVKAIQELKAENDTLKARVDDLEERLLKLESNV